MRASWWASSMSRQLYGSIRRGRRHQEGQAPGGASRGAVLQQVLEEEETDQGSWCITKRKRRRWESKSDSECSKWWRRMDVGRGRRSRSDEEGRRRRAKNKGKQQEADVYQEEERKKKRKIITAYETMITQLKVLYHCHEE